MIRAVSAIGGLAAGLCLAGGCGPFEYEDVQTQSTGGTGGQAGSAPDAMLQGDESLVVRYLINEDPEAVPGQIRDSSELRLDMTLYASSPDDLSIREDAHGHRGLLWGSLNATSMASVEIMGRRIQGALTGKSAATFEVVSRLEETTAHTYLFFIGHEGFDDISARFEPGNLLRLDINDNESVHWQFLTAWRTVTHLVLDMTRESELDRTRLYINGELMPIRTTPSAPSQDQTIDIDAATHLALGNRPNDNYSPRGFIYYAAIYDTALTDPQILANAKALLIDDDALEARP